MKFSKEVLVSLRQDRDYSLGILSRMLLCRCNLKISRSAISQWEQGKTCPKISSLLALAKVFQVDPAVFFQE